MSHTWKMILLVGGCNLVASLQGIGYGLLIIGVPGTGVDGVHVFVWAAGALVGSYAVAMPIVRALIRPIERALAGETLPPEALARAQRRALNLPVLIARFSTILWTICALSFIPYNLWARPDLDLFPTLHVVIVTILIGAVSGIFIYYIEEWYCRARVLPRLFPDGRLGHVAGVIPVPIAFKMLVLLVVSGLLPILALTVTALAGTLTPAAIAYVGGSFFFAGVLQALFIGMSINRPVQALAREMEKIAKNDLTARAEVVSTDYIGQLGEGFNVMVAGLRRAAFVKDTFGRYVTRQVLDEILNGKVALGGELRQATVLFSDIRGFTALSERLPAAEVVTFLNRYLDIMVDVIVEHDGTIDKFIGDAVMASFGVPVSREDDALRAVHAALTMIERLKAWNVERERAGEPPIEIGIGLHTGEVVAGNIGSAKKMEYTVIGDTVNTSSRIEQLNKTFGTRLLVSAATFALVRDRVEARALPPVEVHGKRQPITVYEVTALRS
jgi:adenylate cyclase